MQVTISNFGGIVPRYSDHNLNNIAATIAHDVKLRNGRLEAWRELCDYADVAESNLSFHLHGCCTTAWDRVVQAAEVAPDWGRFYITGRINALESVVLDCNCNPSYFLVGVPTPLTPPVATATEECDRATDARAYVYTYINQWYEESAPSPASNIVQVKDGTTVTVSGIAFPPDGYGIIGANIYRAATGFRQADGKVQKPLTDYLYVGTVEFPSTTFTDDVKGIYLGQPLETGKVRMPPNGLRNVCSIDGVVRLAGTTVNQVHLTENFQLHNWPVKYDLTLDSGIVHMGSLDQKLYVTTDTIPYIIDVSSCEDMKCTPVLDIDTSLPDISCGHSSSAIMTPHGYIYSSPYGATLIDPSGKWHILTSRWLSEDDWALVQPNTARFAYWEGFLFIVTDAVTFLLDINGDPYGDMNQAELSTLSDSPVDLKVSNTGKLFMLQNGKVRMWNGADTFREFTWVSRELTGGTVNHGGRIPSDDPALGVMWSPVSGKIRTKGTEFTLISPIQPEAYKRTVMDERPFRLPRVGRHMWYKVRLRGTTPVEFVDLGTAHFTVNKGQ